MSKKAAKTPHIPIETTAAPASAPRKTSASRAKKHLKAQAVGVAAAVEEFVHAIVSPAAEVAPAPVSENVHAYTHEDISRLAYQFYLERGGRNGSETDDWVRAEQALQSFSASAR